MDAEVPAVFVRNAEKCYVQGCKVLSDLSMTVPKGSIYGLLGASGCGKTTLLGCIVARNHLDSGEICVLGGKPGTIGSGIPGPGVGYMPQETALCSEFTAQETIYFFGRLMKVPEELIKKRFYELQDLLELPPSDRLVKDCSGGQQRRISFASALIHNPQLLILDEPTAGVDPLLRDRIWTYLKDLTMKKETTVIITTHYIEESRRSDFIGLMRGGKLLAEAPPDNLIHMFKAETLEDVFLELCLKQEKKISNSSSATVSMNNYDGSGLQELELFPLMSTAKPNIDEKGLITPSALGMHKNRLLALLDKNWKQLYRNVSGWVFLLFVLPILCSMIFIFVIGADMKDLKFAIINEDTTCLNVTLANSIEPVQYGRCHMENLGCIFLEFVKNEPLFIHKAVGSLSEAVEGIRTAKYTGAIYIPRNHSYGIEERVFTGQKSPPEVVDLSTIKVFMDMSDYIVGISAHTKLLQLFQKHISKLLHQCGYRDFMTKFISFEPIHGNIGGSSTETMIPGFFISLISYMSTMLTCEIIISERLSGVWDRSAVAGVTVVEVLSTHFVLQFSVMLVQMFEVLVVVFVIYGAEMQGSFWILSLFGVLQGVYGICYGFLMSIISKESYFNANVFIAGGFYPTVLISGTFWPIESQPEVLQWISRVTPFTIPTESFRNVLKKGWDLTNYGVLKGLGVEVAWIAVLTVFSIYFLKKLQ
ncbi:ABC transporter G family member 23-like [Coccinella septempunctata]|uniref:ABC transporter G family member 23-like n=1 Tax=Coccinella septempunctata TaxID=41139 RepID=UPI001D066276|nr:ABC transporter G family member 23-like [Coccinella septempunctata]